MQFPHGASCSLLFCVVSVAVLFAVSPDERVQVQIQNLKAGTQSSGDPDVAFISLDFQAQVTNLSRKTLSIPVSPSGKRKSVRHAIVGVQYKQPDGMWAYVSQASWYGDDRTTYSRCASLSPMRSARILGISDGFMILRDKLVGLGPEPVIRLQIMFFCRQPNGDVLTNEVTTNEFRLSLAAVEVDH